MEEEDARDAEFLVEVDTIIRPRLTAELAQKIARNDPVAQEEFRQKWEGYAQLTSQERLEQLTVSDKAWLDDRLRFAHDTRAVYRVYIKPMCKAARPGDPERVLPFLAEDDLEVFAVQEHIPAMTEHGAV